MGKETHAADTVTLCTVLINGQDDLVVECFDRFSSTRHIVPKTICTKLSLSPEVLTSAERLEPQIGDLVLSFSRSYKSEGLDKTSGILYKITYRLGKPDACEILSGATMTNVSWDSLIVLRKKTD